MTRCSFVIFAALALVTPLLAQSSASAAAYNPLTCPHLTSDGHCDSGFGAWTYKRLHSGSGGCDVDEWGNTNCNVLESSTCAYDEYSVPHNEALAGALHLLFREVTSVLDFGGGPGKYLTGFRNYGLRDLLTVEPHDLGACVFPNIKHSTLDVVGASPDVLASYHLSYDLVLSLDVMQHIPPAHHALVLDWLSRVAGQWLVFSSAKDLPLSSYYGAEHEEERAPAKTAEQWIEEIEANGVVSYDAETTRILRGSVSEGNGLKENILVFSVVKR